MSELLLCALCDSSRHTPREFEVGWCHACGRPLDHATAYSSAIDHEPLQMLWTAIEKTRVSLHQEAAELGLDYETFRETVLKPRLEDPELPAAHSALRRVRRALIRSALRACLLPVRTPCPAIP